MVDTFASIFDFGLLSVAKGPAKFYSLSREDAANFSIPPVSPVRNVTYTYVDVDELSQYTELCEIPPIPDLENIVSHIRLNSENFNAAIINGKLFQFCDIESVLRVHSLKLLKEKVRKETEWLSLERHSTLNYPRDAIVINPTDIEQFRNILHDGQDNVCVDRNRFPCLL